MRVLVTRPILYSQGLADEIKTLGAVPECFPTIEYRPTLQQTLLKSVITKLDQYDIAVFVSQAAVEFSFPQIHLKWHPLPLLHWAAIGPSTGSALRQQGLTEIILPQNPPYESEILLVHPIFQMVAGKHIVLFRGNGGRDLLAQVLTQRGATVTVVETYERCLPNIDMTDKIHNWQQNPLDVIISTSAQSLHNLIALIDNKLPDFKEIPLVIVGLRMHELANTLEFKKPIMAEGADDASIIKVLTKLKDQQGENKHF